MCIPTGARLFVRRDSNHLLKGVLPDLAKSKISPATHMNYGGTNSYVDTGYLSLFEYNPNQSYAPDGQNLRQAAAFAMDQIAGTFIHFIFLPALIQVVQLNEENVRSRPETGRTPTLFDSSGCQPPARVAEDGRVLEYANRYICEFLLAGAWALGTTVITEKAASSALLSLMRKRTPLADITGFAGKVWPCRRDDDDEKGPPPASGMGTGSSFGPGQPKGKMTVL